MKINYIKTMGFRKFKKVFETELYDITNISGKNRSGKSNILYAIVNIMLGTNLSGDEKACLINKNCDGSYGELHFTDNNGIDHILIRGKHRYNNKNNFIILDGKNISQSELSSFYKDKKLFLSIINPLYFLNKKPVEQKELVDRYLADIKPKIIFDTLTKEQQNYLINKYFYISMKEIYPKLCLEELQDIYDKHNLQSITGKPFTEILDKEKWKTICKNINVLKDVKYYKMLSEEEKETFINHNMFDICMDIAYSNLSTDEQKILEESPRDIPTYITEINGDIKKSEFVISNINGKIEYAQNIVNEELPAKMVFDKEEELSLLRQEHTFLNTNQDIVDKEKQKKTIEKLQKEILHKETEFNEIEREMKQGKKKYLDIKDGICSTCPTCNQYIQDESKNIAITNMKNKLISAYDKSNLLQAQLKDLQINLTVEKCKYHSLDGNTTIEKSKRIDVIEENIKTLENEKKQIEKFNNEISLKERTIANTKTDIIKLNAEKQAHIKCIENMNTAKKVAQKLYISYIEEKMKLAKKYLKDVDIKFYSVLKTTGEIKEDFIITYKNNPLSDLSRSETIATALEFANMFNKITGVNFPIFVDDYESCADYDFIREYEKNTQLIISKVEKGKKLKISDANSDKHTIIKPIITGFKTINTHKNNVAEILNAA